MPDVRSEQCVIEVEITGVRFENPETGFAVVQALLTNGTRLTVCGQLSGLQPGEQLELTGRYEYSPKFGRQFRADSFKLQLPKTASGIERYLTNCIKGIGPKTAEIIVRNFGGNTVNVLDNYPKRLREIPGIGPKKYEQIIEVWKRSRARRDSMIFLQSLGISNRFCEKLFRVYGETAAELVKKNPFRLAEDISGIGFAKADVIAQKLGMAPNSPERLGAAAVFAVNNLAANGHVGVPETELLGQISELTGCDQDDAQVGIKMALGRKRLIAEDHWLYLPELLRAERQLPLHLKKLVDFPGKPPLVVDALKLDPRLADAQKKAVVIAGEQLFSVITGGPGVGKTTVIGTIVKLAKRQKLRLALAAPTGRAAKRLGEATGEEGKTIHRLLAYDPVSGHFTYGPEQHFECDLLIVDECSMLDIVLAEALLSAISPGTGVIMVGDADQLPPVGPGNFFRDLINSAQVPVTRLTEVFRQAEGSQIIASAHQVNCGVLPRKPPVSADLSDFYWIEQDDPEKAAKIIQTLVTERIPARFSFDAREDIQVLTPMNRGGCGTNELNEKLRQKLNPPVEPGKTPTIASGYLPRRGDKVMQTCNDYDKGVFNGDFGYVLRVDDASGRFWVCFDNQREVEYLSDEAGKLTLGYAITIHKSQGCEFPAVVVALLPQHYLMLQRNLLYTAMTRAKKLLVLIGSRKTLEMAVSNFRCEERFSRLPERLSAAFGNAEVYGNYL